MTDPLVPIARRQRQDITLLFMTLADGIANAAAQSPDADGAMTGADQARIIAEVERGLDVIFGRRRGDDEAALRTIVIRDTRLARLAPLDTSVKKWRKAMGPELRARVEAEAQT